MLQNQCLKMIEEDPNEFESNIANNRSTMIYLDILGPLNKGYDLFCLSKSKHAKDPYMQAELFSKFSLSYFLFLHIYSSH